ANHASLKNMFASMSDVRMAVEDVVVPVEEVQESGLIKDVVELRIPNEIGKSFDGVFVREAAKILSDTTSRWNQYHKSPEYEGEEVVPLMVVQKIGRAHV